MCYCEITKEYFNATSGKIAIDSGGELHLVSPQIAEHLKRCEDCGAYLYPDVIDEEQVEAGLYSSGLKYTDFLSDETKYICPECQDNWYRCEHCDQLSQSVWGARNYSISQYEIRVCEDCLNEYYSKCECCNEYFSNNDMFTTEDDYRLCEYCYDNRTTECADCDRRFYHEDNMEWDEDREVYLCDQCYEEGPRVINSYNYKPYARKLLTTKDKSPIEFFGFEIEVAGYQKHAESFLQEVGSENEEILYLKHDGSVAGFEIVTQPMTRNYFYDYFIKELEKGMKYLRENNFRGHNKGGIHIHVSREAISEDQLKNLVVLLYPKTKKVKNMWLAITQRKESEMDSWARMDSDVLDNNKKETIKYIEKIKKEKEEGKHTDVYINECSRYSAINTRNKNTIEFRIFNSNTRIERIVKNAEVIFSLLDFTKTKKLPTMTNYMKFVEKNKNKYKYLFDFLIEKKIWQSEEQKEQAKKIVEVINHSGNNIKQNEISQYIESLNIVQNFNVGESDHEEIHTEQTVSTPF